MEGDDGPGVFTGPHDLHRPERLALGVILPKNLPLAVHLSYKAVGQGVDAGHTHAVKAS